MVGKGWMGDMDVPGCRRLWGAAVCVTAFSSASSHHCWYWAVTRSSQDNLLNPDRPRPSPPGSACLQVVDGHITAKQAVFEIMNLPQIEER